MSTTTQSLRQQLVDMIQQLDEGHLTAAQAFLHVLAISKPAPLPQARSFVPMPPDTEAMKEAQIVTDPEVAFGKPVIAGTRVAVEIILEELAAGETIDDILDNHPHLTCEQVQAALEYAKRAVNAMQRADAPRETDHVPA